MQTPARADRYDLGLCVPVRAHVSLYVDTRLSRLVSRFSSGRQANKQTYIELIRLIISPWTEPKKQQNSFKERQRYREKEREREGDRQIVGQSAQQGAHTYGCNMSIDSSLIPISPAASYISHPLVQACSIIVTRHPPLPGSDRRLLVGGTGGGSSSVQIPALTQKIMCSGLDRAAFISASPAFEDARVGPCYGFGMKPRGCMLTMTRAWRVCLPVACQCLQAPKPHAVTDVLVRSSSRKA